MRISEKPNYHVFFVHGNSCCSFTNRKQLPQLICVGVGSSLPKYLSVKSSAAASKASFIGALPANLPALD